MAYPGQRTSSGQRVGYAGWKPPRPGGPVTTWGSTNRPQRTRDVDNRAMQQLLKEQAKNKRLLKEQAAQILAAHAQRDQRAAVAERERERECPSGAAGGSISQGSVKPRGAIPKRLNKVKKNPMQQLLEQQAKNKRLLKDQAAQMVAAQAQRDQRATTRGSVSQGSVNSRRGARPNSRDVIKNALQQQRKEQARNIRKPQQQATQRQSVGTQRVLVAPRMQRETPSGTGGSVSRNYVKPSSASQKKQDYNVKLLKDLVATKARLKMELQKNIRLQQLLHIANEKTRSVQQVATETMQSQIRQMAEDNARMRAQLREENARERSQNQEMQMIQIQDKMAQVAALRKQIEENDRIINAANLADEEAQMRQTAELTAFARSSQRQSPPCPAVVPHAPPVSQMVAPGSKLRSPSTRIPLPVVQAAPPPRRQSPPSGTTVATQGPPVSQMVAPGSKLRPPSSKIALPAAPTPRRQSPPSGTTVATQGPPVSQMAAPGSKLRPPSSKISLPAAPPPRRQSPPSGTTVAAQGPPVSQMVAPSSKLRPPTSGIARLLPRRSSVASQAQPTAMKWLSVAAPAAETPIVAVPVTANVVSSPTRDPASITPSPDSCPGPAEPLVAVTVTGPNASGRQEIFVPASIVANMPEDIEVPVAVNRTTGIAHLPEENEEQQTSGPGPAEPQEIFVPASIVCSPEDATVSVNRTTGIARIAKDTVESEKNKTRIARLLRFAEKKQVIEISPIQKYTAEQIASDPRIRSRAPADYSSPQQTQEFFVDQLTDADRWKSQALSKSVDLVQQLRQKMLVSGLTNSAAQQTPPSTVMQSQIRKTRKLTAKNTHHSFVSPGSQPSMPVAVTRDHIAELQADISMLRLRRGASGGVGAGVSQWQRRSPPSAALGRAPDSNLDNINISLVGSDE